MLFIKPCGRDIIPKLLFWLPQSQRAAQKCRNSNRFNELLAGHNAEAFDQETITHTTTIETVARALDFWPNS